MQATIHLLLGADVLPPTPGDLGRGASLFLDGFAPVLAAILGLAGVAVAWLVLFRRRERRPGERGRLLTGAEAERRQSGHRHHGKRRRRERRRPANPTLAETGGLPPVGAGEPKPPNL